MLRVNYDMFCDMLRVACQEGHDKSDMLGVICKKCDMSRLTCEECQPKSGMSRVTGQEWQFWCNEFRVIG